MQNVISIGERGRVPDGECGVLLQAEENVWMVNQLSAGLDAYENASSAEAKLGTFIFPTISTCPRKVSPGWGMTMEISAVWATKKRTENNR